MNCFVNTSVEDDVSVQNGTTAWLRATQSSAALKRNLEGERVGFNDGATDDLVGIQEGQIATEKDRQRKTGQEEFTLTYIDIEWNKKCVSSQK